MKSKTIIKKILTFINYFVPKNSNKIAFFSHPDFSDNTKAFYNYIAKNTKYECIWFVSSQDMIDSLKELNIKAFIRNSLNGFFEFSKCKYVVSSDFENLAIKSNNQIHIALSHGMPLKKNGLLLSDLPKVTANSYKKIDYTLCTSEMFQPIIQDIFGLEQNKVLISGHPRNDFFFNSNRTTDLNKMLNVNIKDYDKVIMYIPTFRKHAVRNDGVVNINNILNLSLYDENELNKYLAEKNYLLITKLHPAEQAIIKSGNYSNIKMLDSDVMTKSLITLNEILNLSDLLITDYSSVYYDFMILDKPLLFINTDEEQYSDLRGFVFDDIDFYRPGPKVSTLNMLTKECTKLLSDDSYYKKERREVNKICNTYCDDKSSERIFNIVFKNDKNI